LPYSLGIFKDSWNFQEEEVTVSKKRPILEPALDDFGLPLLAEDGITPMSQQATDENGSPMWEDYPEKKILRKDRPKIEYVPEDEFAICPDDIDIQTADTRCLYLAHKPKAVTKEFLLDQVELGLFDKKAVDSILYEDDALVVINKTAGIIVHPDKSHDYPALTEWLEKKYKDYGIRVLPDTDLSLSIGRLWPHRTYQPAGYTECYGNLLDDNWARELMIQYYAHKTSINQQLIRAYASLVEWLSRPAQVLGGGGRECPGMLELEEDIIN